MSKPNKKLMQRIDAIENQIKGQTKSPVAQLRTQQAALILLAHHIARRGKKLHQEKVEKNLPKLGEYANVVANEMDFSITTTRGYGLRTPIYYELKKYGVTLFDIHSLSHLYCSWDNTVDNEPDDRPDAEYNLDRLYARLQVYNKATKEKLSKQISQFE